MPNLISRELNKELAASLHGGQPSEASIAEAPARDADTADSRFGRAIECLEEGDTAAAFAELSELASQGHAPSARIALMLARRGTSLFGGSFSATAAEQAQWQRCGD